MKWSPESLRDAYTLAARCEVSFPLGHVIRWHQREAARLHTELAALEPFSDAEPGRVTRPRAVELLARAIAHEQAIEHFVGKARELQGRPMEQPLEQFIERFVFAADLLADKIAAFGPGDHPDDVLARPLLARAQKLLADIVAGLDAHVANSEALSAT